MAADTTRYPDESKYIEQFRQRLEQVEASIRQAALAAGRDPASLTLIGVSKQFPAFAALAACRVGIRDLGENRVQDLLAKKEELAAAGEEPHWHMIGTLQRNKVKQLVGRVHLIHSVDSPALMEEISRRSQAGGLVSDILLQVNSSGEASKHGFDPDALPAAVEQARSWQGIRLCGLMTMAQLAENPDETLPVFTRTQALFERLAEQQGHPAAWSVLSMGMSQDYLQAIRCGATHLRIGSALFGPRPQA